MVPGRRGHLTLVPEGTSVMNTDSIQSHPPLALTTAVTNSLVSIK